MGQFLELSAQLAIKGERWGDAHDFLERGADHFGKTKGFYIFFNEKWKNILAVEKSNGQSDHLKQLQEMTVLPS